ncbi:hypothetical protein BC629DRAFT_519727 [Irpex lacteus]|nr:hypothetical protein BC629DRAFT_519727 [Irpex lacteus]
MPVATTTYTSSRPSYSSQGPSSPETRKWNKQEEKLIVQYGSKLHAYGRDKAPYPFSFDTEVLQLECMDHAFMRNLKGSVSCIDFKGDTPLRCLDLGTGVSPSASD